MDNRALCLQAIEELNIKPKFWKDLLTDEPFTRKDIIHLQDPLNLQVRDLLIVVQPTELHRVQLGWLWCLVLCTLLHAARCIPHGTYSRHQHWIGCVLDQALNAYVLVSVRCSV